MSTKVDLTYKSKHVHVETVSEMSTKVDEYDFWFSFFVETVSEMSTEADGGMKRQDKCVETMKNK